MSPVSHGVCNVVKRVVIIGTSVVFFGTTLTNKTKLGARPRRAARQCGPPWPQPFLDPGQRPGRSEQHWLADTGVEPLANRSGWLMQARDTR